MGDEGAGTASGLPCEVFVGGVPDGMTQETLQNLMQENFGAVASVNWRDGRNFQFVTFAASDSAATALATGQSFQLPDGQSVQIRPAKRQRNNNNNSNMGMQQPMMPGMHMLPMMPFPMGGPGMNAGGGNPSSRPPFSESDKLTNYKLVVTQLPPGTQQADVVSYFAQVRLPAHTRCSTLRGAG
eukprot:2993729-Rhodomonas_salina.2